MSDPRCREQACAVLISPSTDAKNRACTTTRAHTLGMPSWLRADRYTEERIAYYQGFTDVRGNWWCGQCFYRCALINRGEALGYPELPPSFRMEGSPITGYEGWLALAQQGSQVAVETAVRFVFAPLAGALR